MTISQDLSAPLVVVVGATGTQGGSVIKGLAESDKPYRIRGLTRDPSKPAALKLKAQGVELFSVSISVDNADKDKIYKAFEGANIAFAMTNFWEHMDKQREIGEGILMVDAAKAAKVELLIWSGLMPVGEISGGKYSHVDHFDGKAAVTAYGRKSGVPFADVQAGMYASNFLTAMAPRKQGDGSYELALPFHPDLPLPIIDMESDYGLFVREAIESPVFGPGSEILTCGESISIGDIVKQLGEITGKKVTYRQISNEDYTASMGSKVPDRIKQEFVDQFEYGVEFGYYNGKSVLPSQQHLARKPHTWADFVEGADWSKVLV